NPSTLRSLILPVTVSFNRTPSTLLSPWTSSTVLFQRISILSLAKALSCIALLPLSSSRRWIRYTLLANLVRNVASSRAVSPPPTTAISLPLKKNPSQVAQLETPFPRKRVSLSIPSHFAEAPVAKITASAEYFWPSASIVNGR